MKITDVYLTSREILAVRDLLTFILQEGYLTEEDEPLLPVLIERFNMLLK